MNEKKPKITLHIRENYKVEIEVDEKDGDYLIPKKKIPVLFINELGIKTIRHDGKTFK